ncbi:MAG TPA: HlyD family efflux transporter periplasmic adaptor subunit [Gemmatimonadaceae bacterium]|nr:HlyD family efflux transporter periplasmic adaptor subunit [Gemmatimonadaceae bacterium]
MPSVVHLLFALLTLALGCRRDGDGGEGEIEATGTVEVVEVDVAAPVPARVAEVRAREGDVVRRGDTLAMLTQPTLRADIEARRARVAAAEAALRELENGARRPELERAEAELRVAQAEAVRTARDAERYATLEKSQAISRQQYDAARAAATQAAGRRDAAREALRLLQQGARPERVQGARAEVENARAAVAAAQATASDLVLVAPEPGTVLRRHAEPGEVLGGGEPVLTMGVTSRPWVRVYVSQLALPRLAVGQPAVGTLDGLPGRRFAGRVVQINDRAEYTPRVALTEEERADLMFGVKVEFDDTTGVMKAGLPVTVRLGMGDGGRGMKDAAVAERGAAERSR